MSIGSYLVRVGGGLAKDLAAVDAAALSAAKTVTSYVDGVLVNDIDPAVESLFTTIIPDEVAALKPYAVTALQDITGGLPALIAGGWEAFVAAVGPALLAVGTQATAAGLTVAKTDALAAVTSVVADAQNAVAASPAS